MVGCRSPSRAIISFEYLTLFKNLASGEPLSQGDAFRRPGGRKSYASDADARRDGQVIKKLPKAGFLQEKDSGITYVPR